MGLYLEYIPSARKRQPHRQMGKRLSQTSPQTGYPNFHINHISIDTEEMPIKTARSLWFSKLDMVEAPVLGQVFKSWSAQCVVQNLAP